jgi:predicted GH43/DUF377 family glycosyl hydrolase
MKPKIFSFVLALVLIVTSGLSAAQAEPFLPGGWVKAGGNPLLSPGSSGAWDDQYVFAPSVILDASTYKMWYAASSIASTSKKIGYATSPDGTIWTKYGTAPVLSPGAAGSWDANGASFPIVIKEGSTYKMWYTGVDASSIGRVGYATSPDGITWTKYAGNPVLTVGGTGSWDSVYVGMTGVVKVGTTYKLWYRGGSADSGGIGYATSPDGTTWTKSGTAAVLPNLGYDWDSTPYHPSVIYDGKVYHMWYSGCDYSGSTCQEGYATSPDGATWTRRQAVIPMGTTGDFDDESTDHAAVLQAGNTLKMYYSGYHAGVYAIGLATAPAPLVDTSYTWHTFYGTSNIHDSADAVTVDAEGNSYVLGTSMSTWNGPAGQAPLHAHNPGSNMDVFVMKLNSAGEYQWHTFYGGLVGGLDNYNNVNDGHDIELDASGNIYVLGTSRHSWGTPLHAHNEISDSFHGNLFVMKLSPSGTYQWHTFYEQTRSSGTVGGRRLAVDASGNAYVATSVKVPWSDTMLTPLHPYSGIDPGKDWNSNMLILKLNSNGAYQWHTFYGTTPSVDLDDWAWDIAADAGGNTYITGGGTAWGSPLHAHHGSTDIIVLKLNTNGAYQWHTYYGSEQALKVDAASGITLDRNGFIYVTGVGRPFLGSSGEQPLHPFSDAGETAYNDDTFVLKLTPAGGYVWHTWYGSPGEEVGYSTKPVTDSQGNVYLVGAEGSESYGASSWNGPDGQAPLHPYKVGSNNNYFIMKLTTAGVYNWHMFFESKTTGFGLAVDAQNSLVMDGTSRVAWNGPDGQLPLQAYLGSAYIIKYSYDLFSLTNLSQYSAAEDSSQFTLTVTGKKFLDGAVVQWNGAALATTFVNDTTLTALVPANQLLSPGVYPVRVVNPAPEAATSNARYVFVTPTGAGVNSQGSGTSSTAEGSATATASGITASGTGVGTLVVARYSANPGGATGFANNTGAYTDVYIAPGSAFISLTIVNCALNGGNTAYWWNGSIWQAASNQSYDGVSGCATITVNASTSPSLSDLTGTPFGTGFIGNRVYLPIVKR